MIGLREDEERTPGAEDWLPARVETLFGPGGELARDMGLEHRPEQAEMALRMAQNLVGNEPLLFEAGTGVGKSLAYLIPGIVWAIETGRPLVVSTHTISLQQQLESKDLPLCRKIFQKVEDLGKYSGFATAVLVGKGNYLCPNRLARLRKETPPELLPSDESLELKRLDSWASQTQAGLRHELSPLPSPEVWDQVNADSSQCSRRHCSPETCFFQAAKAKVANAQVRILNHSLLFSLIQAGAVPPENRRGILFPDDAVVLDEAHTVPGIASEHFGLRLSSYAIDFGLKRLFNPRKRSGLLKRQGRTADLKAVESALAANADFFQFIAGQFLRQRDVVRITEPGFVEDVLSARLRAVVETLGAVESRTEKEEQVEEIRDHKRRIQGFHSGLGDFLKLARDDHVHWLEKSGRRGSIVALRTAPINVAPYLKEALFARESAAVLTSATLSIGDEMANFQKSIGGEGLDTGIEASPFDFKRNLRVFIATDAPAPQPQNQARLDRDYLLDMLTWCTTRIAGGSLILFTSYADLNGIATDLQANLQEWGRPVFIQGRDESRQEITRAFAAAGNGILLGTESFWTGVDVPGPALSQVVITRLPFDNPTHPIPQARSEAIEARGGNPFAEMALPEAMLKFRQGVGRLIRKADDRGCVTILDSRILNKSYGQRFIEQLPVKQYRRLNKSNRSTVFPNHEEF